MSGFILVIDNSRWFCDLVKQRIESELSFKVRCGRSLSDAADMIHGEKIKFFVAIVGLYVQDAPAGAIVDFVVSKNIPTIVFTGKFNDEIRESILSKKVIDYVIKEDIHSLDYIISLIKRIKRNRHIKVLVVDDSAFVRDHIGELLSLHQYQVFKAPDGKKACEILEDNTDIKLIITDYRMPDMDGFQLTKRIRQKHRREELAIIGFSGQGCNKLSAKFIKNGANDFISKPFLTEEFYCRITQNIDMIEYIKAIKDASNKDYLTGLYNRRYFFESGAKMHANSKRKHITIAIAMVDIDHFKKVNDSYGHDAGDIVLVTLSKMLKDRFRESDIVSRFGGEEFCILVANMYSQYIRTTFESLREAIENTKIPIGNQSISVTVSIGVCAKLFDNLEGMIKGADAMLYQAKQGGRNMVKVFIE